MSGHCRRCVSGSPVSWIQSSGPGISAWDQQRHDAIHHPEVMIVTWTDLEQREIENLERIIGLPSRRVVGRALVDVAATVGWSRSLLMVLQEPEHRATSRERVAELASAYARGASIPSIAVARRGDGFVVRDGHHRLCGADDAGLTQIPGLVLEE